MPHRVPRTNRPRPHKATHSIPRRMLQHGANLLQRDAREPLDELRHECAVFEVLEQRRHGYPRTAKHPNTAHALRVALDGWTGRPIDHEAHRTTAAREAMNRLDQRCSALGRRLRAGRSRWGQSSRHNRATTVRPRQAQLASTLGAKVGPINFGVGTWDDRESRTKRILAGTRAPQGRKSHPYASCIPGRRLSYAYQRISTADPGCASSLRIEICSPPKIADFPSSFEEVPALILSTQRVLHGTAWTVRPGRNRQLNAVVRADELRRLSVAAPGPDDECASYIRSVDGLDDDFVCTREAPIIGLPTTSHLRRQASAGLSWRHRDGGRVRIARLLLSETWEGNKHRNAQHGKRWPGDHKLQFHVPSDVARCM